MSNDEFLKLNTVFENQKQSFLAAPYPTYKDRISVLKQLKSLILENQKALLSALDDDFGHRKFDESRLIEIFPVISSLNYIIKHLKRWMKPQKRHASLLYFPSRNYVFYQPKGIVGIIVPWNYPLVLSIIPIAYAIAAGNRVMVKLSELSPKIELTLIKIFQRLCSEDDVCFIQGDVNVAQAFSQLAFDHLFFTGSTTVGRQVMKAASENLTPITLELGGKSPVIISEKATIKKAAASVCFAKYVNSGQTCIAPDYIYLSELVSQQFIEALIENWHTFSQGDFSDLTSLISDKQLQRMQALLEDAKSKGAVINVLGQQMPWSEAQLASRQLPLCIVTNISDDMLIAQEEIFGPILPIISFKRLDDVIKSINQKPRALSLYFYGKESDFELVTRKTHAGGICFNDALMHIAQDDLPFGGIGPSGMGSYHAKEGFETFSHAKAVYLKSRYNPGSLIYPPFNRAHRLLFKFFLR
ncbi:coniferyl aldehyde dehydrogenase [Thiotrichales bacterium 19S3-7]|nr:coniferyl aldehyde dehydrogenase [Thiotrichales bacterium 19S3-7]MCF6800663.1 coniferyl aldehyde dehydrogenase [Thiotrichales bacterium 19S3-11]